MQSDRRSRNPTAATNVKDSRAPSLQTQVLRLCNSLLQLQAGAQSILSRSALAWLPFRLSLSLSTEQAALLIMNSDPGLTLSQLSVISSRAQLRVEVSTGPRLTRLTPLKSANPTTQLAAQHQSSEANNQTPQAINGKAG